MRSCVELSTVQKRFKLHLMVLTAFAVRLAVIPFTIGEWMNPRYLSQYEPGNVAIALIHGQGFASPWVTGAKVASAVMSPVYPLIVAGIYRIFGVSTQASIATGLALNCLLSALACIPVFLITRRSFGQDVAMWAGWAWVFSPYGIYFAAEWLWPTHLLLLCMCWLFHLAQHMEQSSQSSLWISFGLVAGFAALSEPSVLAIIPFLACFCACRLAFERKAWRTPLALATCVTAVVVSPWIIRNAVVFHRFIPMRSGIGLEMYIGNQPDAIHWTSMKCHPNHNSSELAEYRAGEIAYMDHKMQQSKDYIGRHKLWYARQCARRAGYLWTGFWSLDPAYRAEEPMDLVNVPVCTLLTLLAIVGLVIAWKEHRLEAIRYGGVLFFYPLIYYFVHPEAYRMRPLDPFIGILGCVAAQRVATTATFTSVGILRQTEALIKLLPVRLTSRGWARTAPMVPTVHGLAAKIARPGLRHVRFAFVAVMLMSGVRSSGQENLPDAPKPNVAIEPASYSSSLDFEPPSFAGQPIASHVPFRKDGLNVEEHQRVLGIVPNFYTVYGSNPAPLTARQKFHLAWKSELDPENLGLLALNAAMEKPGAKKHSGVVAQHYPVRMAVDWAQDMGGVMLGKVLLDSVLHEDPRFFYRDTPSKWSRIWYSVWSDFTTRSDKGRVEPAYSTFASAVVAHASVNLFYKPDQRIPAGTIVKEILMGRLSGIGDNLAQEFVFHRLTSKRRASNDLSSQ